MKRTLVRALVATVAMASTAYAEKEMSSEYYHQAAGMTQELVPSLEYRMGTLQANGNSNAYGFPDKNFAYSNATTNTNGFGAFLKYDYGLNEDMAVGLGLGIENFNTSSSMEGAVSPAARSGNGLTSLKFRFQGRVPMVGPGNLIYGANGQLSLVRAAQGAGNGGVNGTDGYHYLAPYLAYEMELGPGMIGAHFDYEVFRSDRKIDFTNAWGSTFEVRNKAGAHWAWGLFYELPVDAWQFGLAVNVITTNDSQRSFTPKGTADYGGVDPASVDLQSKLYVNYALEKDISIIPSIQYTTLTNSYREGAKLDTDNETAVAVAGRFTF